MKRVIFASGSRLERIGWGCFRGSEIEGIVLPGTLREIGGCTFESCSSLRTVHVEDGCQASFLDTGLPSSVQIIPRSAAVGVASVLDLRLAKHISIPEGTERVGSYWFWGSGIEGVEIPSSVREIGACAFSDCRKLNSLVFRADAIHETEGGSGRFQSRGSRLRVIEREAFYNCASLKSAELPDGLEEIGLNAFGASGLESFVAPKALRMIHQSAFFACVHLKKAVLNEGLEVFGTAEYRDNGEPLYGVFEGSTLGSVVFPSTLKRIEYSAFCHCGCLKSVVLPEGLEGLGERCFARSGLRQISLPRSLRRIGEDALSSPRL